MDIGFGGDFFFLNITPKTKATKMKINYETKEFCSAKETIKIKRQPTTWKKMFANHLSGKGLIFRTHRELLIFKTKIKQPNSKMSKGPQRRYTNGQ